MERLTQKSDKMIWLKDQGLKIEPCEMNSHHCRMILEKLADYEDLEEQGLLVRLPCKVGDTVYKFWYYDRSPYKIQQHVIRTLSEICELIESKKLGKYVFLTREEAENKLEEMKKNGE